MLSLLADTNVFIDFAVRDPGGVSERALRSVLAFEGRVVIVPQVISEIWNVLTREADRNGIRLSPEGANQEIRKLLELFPLYPDPPEVTGELLRIALHHKVLGRQIHDARLAVLANLHGLNGIVTHNVADFARFHVLVRKPDEILKALD